MLGICELTNASPFYLDKSKVNVLSSRTIIYGFIEIDSDLLWGLNFSNHK